ncbi:acetolactate synthase large subunit [Natronomonas sp. LN261]|jgi:acetolactate synthase-1/2/3 large subunit|uniref:acetolactate synthase large subunit n=1 Tax=Natronomonas sp. LN261 TaxID=2750669 RepID=UPI0015EF3B49|nr:acetolactate synthase large subunit [Natronomonas sp. LN261]
MRASDLLVACLEREGVEHVFGLPGEEMEELLFSLRDSSVTFVPVRHELGAAFMADVHGRLTGDAGVCLATLGPGATNLLTGVADAHLDKSPLVAITAQGGLERLHQESHQAIDVLRMFEPVTKWNTRLDSPDIVHESVRKAFKIAEYEKPGATHLELPEDVAAEGTAARPLEPNERVPFAAPNPDILDRVKATLREVERPVIVAGNGAVRTHAATQLREFVDVTDVPVISTYMGKGAVSDADEHSLMTLDSGSGGEPAAVIAGSDLVITVGYDIAEHDPGDWNPGDAPLVHLDSQPAEVYEAYEPDIEVIADVGRTLQSLSDWCREANLSIDSGWYAESRSRVVSDVDVDPVDEAPFTVRAVLPVLRDVMAADDVLISDVGDHKMAIAQNFPTYEPNTCIISNGLASMGISVPGGVAADLAVDANVVAATGDGGFLMNAAEIETATRLGCEFTVLLFTDDDYGLISKKQRDHTGESFGTELSNPDFLALAESFGIERYRPESADELRAALEAAVDGGMSLVEVQVT